MAKNNKAHETAATLNIEVVYDECDSLADIEDSIEEAIESLKGFGTVKKAQFVTLKPVVKNFV